MSRLSQDGGAPEVRASFEKIMSGDHDNANGGPYTPLELLVMELFRRFRQMAAASLHWRILGDRKMAITTAIAVRRMWGSDCPMSGTAS